MNAGWSTNSGYGAGYKIGRIRGGEPFLSPLPPGKEIYSVTGLAAGKAPEPRPGRNISLRIHKLQ